MGRTTTSAAPDPAIGLEQHPGRGPVARAALDHDRAGVAEQPGQAGPGRDRDDPAAGAGLGAARGGGDLLGEVGDPDPVRPAGRDAGLDRGADVVDVDVDVPQPLAADHDQGVAERREGARAASATASSSASRRYITSYAGPLVDQVGDAPWSPGSARRAERRSAPAIGRRPVSTVSAASRIDAQPATAGVDHAGRTELLELLGGAGERLAGGRGGRGEHVASPGRGSSAARRTAASEAARATVRIVPSTGVPTAA